MFSHKIKDVDIFNKHNRTLIVLQKKGNKEKREMYVTKSLTSNISFM